MGAPIILLHGVGLDRTIWDAVTVELSHTAAGRSGRQTVALDLPGHGGQPPLTHEVSLGDLASDILHRISRTTTGPVHLVGFSVGALIAQYIAVHHPERVLSLTCVSSVCARTPEEAAAVRARLDTAGTDFALGAERAVDRWFPEDATVPGATATQLLRDRTRRILLANDIPSYLHVYRVFATADAELAPELHRITVPVLAVTGEEDPGSTPDMSRRIAERIPSAHVHIIPGARHMVPDTHPELLAALISELVGTAEITTEPHPERS